MVGQPMKINCSADGSTTLTTVHKLLKGLRNAFSGWDAPQDNNGVLTFHREAYRASSEKYKRAGMGALKFLAATSSPGAWQNTAASMAHERDRRKEVVDVYVRVSVYNDSPGSYVLVESETSFKYSEGEGHPTLGEPRHYTVTDMINKLVQGLR